MGLRKTDTVLTAFTGKGRTPVSAVEATLIDRYSTMFNLIKERKGVNGRCLSRSLAMRVLLRRKGIEADLKIGVSLRSGAMEAHAWLEKDGRVLNDHPAVIAQYTPLPLPSVNRFYTFS